MFTTTSIPNTSNAVVENSLLLSRDRDHRAAEHRYESLPKTSDIKRNTLHPPQELKEDILKSIKHRGEKVRINVSGRIFESYSRTLKSKEGSIFRKLGIENYYDTENKEYFFDRDPRIFEAILVYLQCGIIAQPEKVSLKNFIEELQFYGFGEKAWEVYQKEGVKPPHQEHYKSRSELGTSTYIYYMLEYPDVNRFAQFFAVFSSLVIFVSIICYCIATLPQMKKFENILFIIEACCVAWFTVELFIRFILAPQKCSFVKSFMNIVDLVSIIPFYVDLFFHKDENANVVALAMLRILRIARVFRVFKLSRYSKAIFLLVITIKTSVRELLLLLMFILIVMVLFSAAIYYFETDIDDSETQFKSIPHTFWLVIVTITTVGYGDMYPFTLGGKFITSILSITGVVVVALPIPIIVNNFSRFYERIMSKNHSCYQFEFDETKSRQVKEESESFVVTQYETCI